MHLCKKRIVLCILMDDDENVLAVGVNQCSSPDGCKRLDKTSTPDDYRLNNANDCDSVHAEVDAVGRLWPKDRPTRALITGHDFVCQACRDLLYSHGVRKVEVL